MPKLRAIPVSYARHRNSTAFRNFARSNADHARSHNLLTNWPSIISIIYYILYSLLFTYVQLYFLYPKTGVYGYSPAVQISAGQVVNGRFFSGNNFQATPQQRYILISFTPPFGGRPTVIANGQTPGTLFTFVSFL